MTASTSGPVGPTQAGAEQRAPSLSERIGADKVERLVAAFYARVDRDPVIRRFYGKTLTCAIHGLTNFMICWLGGPDTYDVPRARLRRRHRPFAIDDRAADAWLANMKAAVQEVGIPAAEAHLLLTHLEFSARALVNSGQRPEPSHCPAGNPKFDSRMAEKWNRMAEVEELFDAVSKGDLTLLESLLPLRLVPHAELMSHALAVSLDPVGRADGRYGRRPKHLKPLELIEFLLEHRALDVDADKEDEKGRFRHLQALMEAHTGVSRLLAADAPLQARLRAATRDRFLAMIERDPSCVRLVGWRGQTLLHDAALAGAAELAAALVGRGADPNAREPQGHTPLYRASTGEVARVLLAAGATVDVMSGPTAGTPLHQAARRGFGGVAAALLDDGATIDARDSKGQTPLRRAVNCRQIEVVQLLVQRGANPRGADNRGVTPLDVARTAQMKRALTTVELK